MKSNKNAKLRRNLSKYDTGGTIMSGITSGASMAAAGSAFGPIGAIAGGAIGLASGIAGGVMADSQEALAAKKANFNAAMGNERIGETINKQSAGPIFRKGGKLKKCAKGGMTNANAELEKGEPYRLPNGKIEMVSNQAPSHAQGGVPLNLPDGTEILGKDKIFDSTYKKLGAKLKRTQDYADKVLAENSTALSRSTALLNVKNADKQWKSLFSAQQIQNGNSNGEYAANGGIINKEYPMNPRTGFNRRNLESDSILGRNSHRSFAGGGMLNDIIDAGAKSSFVKKFGQVLDKATGLDNTSAGVYDPEDPNLKAFNKKYNTNYVSSGDFTGYKTNRDDSHGDSYILNKMKDDYSVNKGGNFDMRRRLADLTMLQENLKTKPRFAKGGRKGITVHESSNDNIDQGYSYKVNSDSTLHQKYFYNSPDSTFDLEDNGKEYEGVSYKLNRAPVVYNKENPLPMSARLRTSDAIKKLKENSSPQKFSGGGKIDMESVPAAPWDQDKFNKFATEYSSLTGKKANRNDLQKVIKNRTRGGGNPGDWDTVGFWDKYNLNQSNSNRPANTLSPITSKGIGDAGAGLGKSWKANTASNTGLQGGKRNISNNTSSTNTNTTGNNPSYNGGWEDYAAMGAAAIPALYNMGRSIFGKADKMNAGDFQNPYEGEALNAMKDRKYDIDPVLSSIKESNRMADYNAKNYGGSQAEMLNRMQANAINRNRSVSDAYTQKYNIENQYKGDYAQMAMNAGNNRANMNYQVADYNARSQSAKDNLFGQGLGQAAQGTMDYLKYRNQKKNDALKIKALNNGLQYYNYNNQGDLNIT